MAKKKEEKATVGTVEEGDIYVGLGGLYYSKPQIDATKISDCLKNNYVSEQFVRLRGMVFIDKYKIEVKDAAGNEDVKLEQRLVQMCESKGVRLWSKMQMAYADIFGWGCAFFNPVWQQLDNERVLTKLRRLPPESFKDPGYAADGEVAVQSGTFSEILQGITLDAKGEIVFFQTGSTGRPMRLKNVILLKDPVDTELAGTSDLIPIVPIISMLDFCWQAQMQKVNRVGAPIIFIKITNAIKNAVRDDYAFAKKIIQNWGKGTGYQVRDNMEIVTLNLTDNQSALQTIEHLKGRIKEYFSPSTWIKKEGQTIGGNAAAEVALVNEWIKGIHGWMEDQFETLLQEYLDSNAYEGYTVSIQIPEPTPDRSETERQQAETGYRTQSLTTNEIRKRLGAPELSEEELSKLKEDYKTRPQAVPGLAFADTPGNDEALKATVTKLNRKIVKALENEEGETGG